MSENLMTSMSVMTNLLMVYEKLQRHERISCDELANMLNCDILVNELELLSLSE